LIFNTAIREEPYHQRRNHKDYLGGASSLADERQDQAMSQDGKAQELSP
jgi:hypothetical protein